MSQWTHVTEGDAWFAQVSPAGLSCGASLGMMQKKTEGGGCAGLTVCADVLNCSTCLDRLSGRAIN